MIFISRSLTSKESALKIFVQESINMTVQVTTKSSLYRTDEVYRSEYDLKQRTLLSNCDAITKTLLVFNTIGLFEIFCSIKNYFHIRSVFVKIYYLSQQLFIIIQVKCKYLHLNVNIFVTSYYPNYQSLEK